MAASWLVTAPTARNMTAVATMAKAKYSEEAPLIPIVESRPDKDSDDGGRDPEGEGSDAEAGDALGGGAARRGRAAEQEVPAADVLFATEQPRAGQEPPYRTENHERHRDLEGREATHGLKLGSWAEECTHGLVRTVGGGQGITLSRRWDRS